MIDADRLREKLFDAEGATEVVAVTTDADSYNLVVDGDALDVLFSQQVSMELQTSAETGSASLGDRAEAAVIIERLLRMTGLI